MLEMTGVDYSYPGEVTALSGIDLALSPREKVAVLGANGAGKSTLLNVMNGSLRPTNGTVRLQGREIRYNRAGLRELRSQVGMVLQDPDDQLFAASVFEDVSFGPVNQDLATGLVMTRVEAALATMEITDLRDRPTHMLSFGQRKRVAIAGILAMQPAYLLLDEPTAGLDPLGTRQLMSTLDRVCEANTAIMLATHDVDGAYAWADRVVIFDAGRIVFNGDPDRAFVDQDLLRQLRMRPPLTWEVARALQDAGLLHETKALPRDRETLIGLIQRT